MLRYLGCALFEDLSRKRYPDSTTILESHRRRLLGSEIQWRFRLSDYSLKYTSQKSRQPCHTRLMIHWFGDCVDLQFGVVW